MKCKHCGSENVKVLKEWNMKAPRNTGEGIRVKQILCLNCGKKSRIATPIEREN